jgi:ureidoacrylate peracid hydrolase
MPLRGVVTIEARPGNVEVTLSRTAIVVVDLQNDFAAIGGMFERTGIDISVIRRTIEPTRCILEAARRVGVRVVYLKMGFCADLSNSGVPDAPTWRKHLPLHAGDDATAPDGTPSRVLIRDTWNSAIVNELTPEPDDLALWKHRYSGFFETPLHELLQTAGVDTLVFVGATTSICVDATVRDAMYRDLPLHRGRRLRGRTDRHFSQAGTQSLTYSKSTNRHSSACRPLTPSVFVENQSARSRRTLRLSTTRVRPPVPGSTAAPRRAVRCRPQGRTSSASTRSRHASHRWAPQSSRP